MLGRDVRRNHFCLWPTFPDEGALGTSKSCCHPMLDPPCSSLQLGQSPSSLMMMLMMMMRNLYGETLVVIRRYFLSDVTYKYIYQSSRLRLVLARALPLFVIVR
jgi:hypothetical protein